IMKLNLLGAEAVMSLGGIMDLKWANERQVYCGTHCDVQGALQLIGETSVAIFTIAIAAHTFVSIVSGRRLTYRLALWGTYATCAWLFVLLFTLIGWGVNRRKEEKVGFFAPTPFWCWVNSVYFWERMWGEYVWLWIAGVGNIIVYIPLFLILRGCFIGGHDEGDEETTIARRESWRQLGNPICYTFLVLPLSVVRWVGFAGKARPPLLDPSQSSLATAALVFYAIFRLSGLVNVVLILKTRVGLLLINSDGVLPVNDLRRINEENATGDHLEMHPIGVTFAQEQVY
ncbi:hypothetical protein BDV93DRAFT_460094, partial [Ceratobasidium sp. AG-I]